MIGFTKEIKQEGSLALKFRELSPWEVMIV